MQRLRFIVLIVVQLLLIASMHVGSAAQFAIASTSTKLVAISLELPMQWYVQTSSTTCTINTPKEDRFLTVEVDSLTEARISIPSGSVRRDGNCEMRWAERIPKGRNYQFSIGDLNLGRYRLDEKSGHVLFGLEIDDDQPNPFASGASTSQRSTGNNIVVGEQSDGTYVVYGLLILRDDNAIVRENLCFGGRGYDDIASGTKVIARDSRGEIVGIGALVSTPESRPRKQCVFEFNINVPKSTFYEIEIGHRGSIVYAFDDLDLNGWVIGLELGK